MKIILIGVMMTIAEFFNDNSQIFQCDFFTPIFLADLA